jgi:hypothetical protein
MGALLYGPDSFKTADFQADKKGFANISLGLHLLHGLLSPTISWHCPFNQF